MQRNLATSNAAMGSEDEPSSKLVRAGPKEGGGPARRDETRYEGRRASA